MVRHDKPAQILMNLVMILLVVCCVFPFLLMVVASFSSEASLAANGYTLFPSEWSLQTYHYIAKSAKTILRGYGMTILVTVIGTSLNLLFTLMIAYPLSRKELPFRNFFAFYVFFTMLFNGGMVPTYLMYVNTFHIKNTIWAMIIPNYLVGAFYIIMMRSYFTSNIPDALVEAARLDGAGEFRILWKVVLPLSKPMVATLALMVGLTYWNDWINSLYYITNSSLYTIQMILNTMLNNIQFLSSASGTLGATISVSELPSIGIRMGIAVIAVLPILVIYPFFQQYFVKGIVIGGVKG